jgi:hypothetical protein
MKTKLIGLMIVTAVLGLFGCATANLRSWETFNSEEQFKQLKAGDKIALVCNQCESVSEVAVESSAEAMAFCAEGSEVSCPQCKKKVRIVTKGPPKNPSHERRVSYVNEKGEPCFFIAKVADAK